MWRIVLGGLATLQEIETHWSLADLIRANLALSLQEHLQAKAVDRATKEAK